MLTQQQRTMRARLAAHAMHARNDSRAVTAKARASFLSRFEREVDPTGALPAPERARRANHALRAHMTRLAYQSSKAPSILGPRTRSRDSQESPCCSVSPANLCISFELTGIGLEGVYSSSETTQGQLNSRSNISGMHASVSGPPSTTSAIPSSALSSSRPACP